MIDLPWLNQLDVGWLEGMLAARRWLFCIDDHQLTGGQGQMLCSALAESGLGWVCAQRFGVSALPACGGPSDVLPKFAMKSPLANNRPRSCCARCPARCEHAWNSVPSRVTPPRRRLP